VSETVFLDSGIFIAFLNRRDQWHEQAKALFAQTQSRWHSSYLVVAESYSWFLHRHGEEAARSFRTLIGNLPRLKIFDATAGHHVQVERMLDSLRGAKLTYVDASSLCFIEKHKIRRVWSTDHHLGLTGARIIPRS
jgi:predicted nucleic acid-binding protein